MDDNKYKGLTEILTRKKEQLEQKVSNDDNYKVDNNETIENINASIEELKVDLRNNVTELERLNEELKEQQENITTLVGYPDDISDDLKKYKDEDINSLGVLKKEHEEIITKMIGASKDELVVLREKSRKYHKYINEFNNRLHDAKSKADSIKLRIVELQRNNVNINNIISEKNDMLEKMKSDNFIDEVEKNEDITKIKETDKKIIDIKSLSNSTSEAAELLIDEEISNISSELASIEMEIEDRTQEISYLEALLSNDENYKPSLFYGMALQADLMDLNNTKKDYDNKVNNLISANDVLNTEISNLKSKITKENDMILQLEKQKENIRFLKLGNMDDKNFEQNEKYETYVNEENSLIRKQNKCRENIELYNGQIKLKSNEIDVNNQSMKNNIDFVNGILAFKIASKKEEIAMKDSVDYSLKRGNIKLLDEARLELSALYDKKKNLEEKRNKVNAINDTEKGMTDLENRVLSKSMQKLKTIDAVGQSSEPELDKVIPMVNNTAVLANGNKKISDAAKKIIKSKDNAKVVDMKKVPKSINPYRDDSMSTAVEPNVLGQVVAVEEPSRELKSKLKLPKLAIAIGAAFVVAVTALTAIISGKFNELEEQLENLKQSYEESANLNQSLANNTKDENVDIEQIADNEMKNSEVVENTDNKMSIDEAVNGVLKGDFFNGEARIVALKAEGFTDAEIDQIQSKVNAALKGNNSNSNITNGSNSNSNSNSGTNETIPDGGLGGPGGNSGVQQPGGEDILVVPQGPGSVTPEVNVTPGPGGSSSDIIIKSETVHDDSEKNDFFDEVEDKKDEYKEEMEKDNEKETEVNFKIPIPSKGGLVVTYNGTVYVINTGGDENLNKIKELAGDEYSNDYSKIGKIVDGEFITDKELKNDSVKPFSQQKTVEDAIEPVPYKVSEGLCYLFNVNGQKLAFNLTEDVTLSVPGYDMNPIDSDYVMNYSRSEISFRDDVTVESEGTLTYEELKAMNNIDDEDTLENDLEQTAPEVTTPETEVTPETNPENEVIPDTEIKSGDSLGYVDKDMLGNVVNTEGVVNGFIDADGNKIDLNGLSNQELDALNEGVTIEPNVASSSNAMKL